MPVAGMAELADAKDLKSFARESVWVRDPLPAPFSRPFTVPGRTRRSNDDWYSIHLAAGALSHCRRAEFTFPIHLEKRHFNERGLLYLDVVGLPVAGSARSVD